MAREVQASDGTRWTCVQAYEGLQGLADDAARVAGSARYRTVCTPSGGRRSVELELEEGWEDSLADEDLLEHIRSKSDPE